MIELKPQLPILTYPDGLKTFVSQQTERRARVKTAIDNATVAVEKARADVVVPVIGDSKRVGNASVTLRTSEDAKLQSAMRSHAQRQTVKPDLCTGRQLGEALALTAAAARSWLR